jgi:hypothetical protein
MVRFIVIFLAVLLVIFMIQGVFLAITVFMVMLKYAVIALAIAFVLNYLAKRFG